MTQWLERVSIGVQNSGGPIDLFEHVVERIAVDT